MTVATRTIVKVNFACLHETWSYELFIVRVRKKNEKQKVRVRVRMEEVYLTSSCFTGHTLKHTYSLLKMEMEPTVASSYDCGLVTTGNTFLQA